ncbi:MAG: Altered inheritance of mitochondria protein 6 [Pycnora praestabilis]|nr:MAG: Altered inheritance of mitochondria protein 6 [Pycnora praestabilis]
MAETGRSLIDRCFQRQMLDEEEKKIFQTITTSARIDLVCSSGTIHLFGFLLSIVGFVFWGEDLESIVSTWGQPGQKGGGMSRWPTDFSSDITPIPCHSHNDYWRHVPLYSAISAGCIGVEADVWLFDEELYVGHNTASLTRNRTLRNLYIDPLVEILDKQNPITDFANATHHGVFDTDPSQTLTLLIDFKTLGSAIWPYVVAQLEPLRQRKYLTIFNGTDMIPGPITVVGTGNTPFDLVLASNTRDIFFDAPLDEMWENREWEEAHKWPKWNDEEPGEVLVEDEGSAEEDKNFRDHPGGNGRHAYKSWQKSHPKAGNPADSQGTGARRSSSKSSPENDDITPTKLVHDEIYTSQNSYYASVSFGKTIGRMWRNRLSHRQMGLIRGQIRGAHRRGLKVRYWDLPNWPIGLRNHVWNVLVREGVDLLNVDDLKGATRTDWRRRDNWW